MLRDIAIITGGTVISEEIGRKLDSVILEDFGAARRVVATKDDTTIVDGEGKPDDIKGRMTQIKAQIEDTTSDYDATRSSDRGAIGAGRSPIGPPVCHPDATPARSAQDGRHTLPPLASLQTGQGFRGLEA